jgi:hypothetical protein
VKKSTIEISKNFDRRSRFNGPFTPKSCLNFISFSIFRKSPPIPARGAITYSTGGSTHGFLARAYNGAWHEKNWQKFQHGHKEKAAVPELTTRMIILGSETLRGLALTQINQQPKLIDQPEG